MQNNEVHYFERKIRVYPKRDDKAVEEKEFSILGDDEMYNNMWKIEAKILLVLAWLNHLCLYMIIALFLIVDVIMPLYKWIFLFKKDLFNLVAGMFINILVMGLIVSLYHHFFSTKIDKLIEDLKKKIEELKQVQ